MHSVPSAPETNDLNRFQRQGLDFQILGCLSDTFLASLFWWVPKEHHTHGRTCATRECISRFRRDLSQAKFGLRLVWGVGHVNRELGGTE